MIRLERCKATDKDFIVLVKQLDENLAISDGDDHAFYDQFNKLDSIKHAIVGYSNQQPVTCGAIKAFDSNTFEIKRMFTLSAERGNGHAVKVLNALEQWAVALGAKRCLLETGGNQPAAIALYKKCGYNRIDNYGQYAGIANSFCFGKVL